MPVKYVHRTSNGLIRIGIITNILYIPERQVRQDPRPTIRRVPQICRTVGPAHRMNRQIAVHMGPKRLGLIDTRQQLQIVLNNKSNYSSYTLY